MSDENTNQEGTKPEGTSGDEILESSAYNRRENLIPAESTQGARDKFSDTRSTSTDTNFGKMDSKGTYFETPETNETSSENLKNNSNSPLQKKKRRLIPYVLIMLALITIILVSAAAILNGFGIGEKIWGISEGGSYLYTGHHAYWERSCRTWICNL